MQFKRNTSPQRHRGTEGNKTLGSRARNKTPTRHRNEETSQGFSVCLCASVVGVPYLNFKRRAFVGSLVALAAAPLSCFGAQEDWSVPALMASLAQVRSARARFVEKRYLSLLRQPVETMGVLVFEAPGRIEKLVQKPKPERMLLEGDVLILETDNGRKRKTMSLVEIPQLTALVGALRGTLSGDMQMLVRYFTVTLEGPRERWRLTLTPTETSSLVRFIRIFGTGVDLTGIEVQQTDGDRSLMLMKKD
jgi:Outer membrane lipoprotein carrier protein LolA-like